MKVGELVIYTEGQDKSGQPIEFNALVLGERLVNDHLGDDGEQLLTLAFAKERTDAFGVPLPVHGTGQTSELLQVRLDVVHESHEYTEAQQRFYGKKQYDGGRWKLASEPSAPAEPAPSVASPAALPTLVPAPEPGV
jgi:hypothetical protein